MAVPVSNGGGPFIVDDVVALMVIVLPDITVTVGSPDPEEFEEDVVVVGAPGTLGNGGVVVGG